MIGPYIQMSALRELVARKELCPREVAEFFLARIERLKSATGRFHVDHGRSRTGRN
jgi:hypothetical protein